MLLKILIDLKLSNIKNKIGNKIVIRPHPAESVSEWKKIVKTSKIFF